MADNAFHDLLRLFRSDGTNARPNPEIDPSRLDSSEYCKNIMAQADKVTLGAEKMAEAAKEAERIAQEAEKIAKKVAEDAEEFVRNKHRLEFHHPHDHFDNHDGRGQAPATTIYHHYHHERATATEISTATITSTFVATSATTITYVTLKTSTAAATSATAASFDTTAASNERSVEDVVGHAASPWFWILLFVLSVNFLTIDGLLNPGLKAKSTITAKQPAPSLMGTKLDITCLKPYITTRPRQVLAVVLCKVVIALYFLGIYWVLDALWRVLRCLTKEVLNQPNHWLAMLMALLIPISLVVLCGEAVLGYVALDQQFALDGELVTLEVPAKKKPRCDACITRRQGEMDKMAMESESEREWQKDGFS